MEGTAESHRVSKAERVTTRRRRCADAFGWDCPHMNRPRWSIGADRVDNDSDVDVSPRIDEPSRLTVRLDDLDHAAEPATGCFGHGPADPIIATPRVTDADDDDAGCHDRSTVRSRKCVAQEMHGS